jgi:hypothetical protein
VPLASRVVEDLGSITEDHMVLEFVRGEIDSRTFGPSYVFPAGWDRVSLLDNGDPGDAEQNRIRMDMLEAVRGYRERRSLFRGFPFDVTWSRRTVDVEELGAFRYLKYEALLALSGPSRRVADGAARIAQGAAFADPENLRRDIEGIAQRLRQGEVYRDLIAVESGDGACVLVEGHKRATAHCLAATEGAIGVLVGRSPGMRGWKFC